MLKNILLATCVAFILNGCFWGDKVEEWTLKGAMIQSANFGDLDWSVSEPAEITLTLRYDYAILQF